MWPYPRILAHRGAGVLAPENTLAAMRCGHAHGFRGVEFDVMLSQDGIPILMHDPAFGRTVPGVGNVAEHSAAQLMKMDAGTWFGAAFAGEPVPGLDQVIDFCRDAGVWMNVEIKPVPGFEVETGAAVATLIRDRFDSADGGATTSGDGGLLPLLSSFSVAALAAARAAAPELPRGLLIEKLPDDWQDQAGLTGVRSLHLNQQFLTEAIAQQVRQAGYGLFCYTVNGPARAAELLRWGVDAFCTDRLDLIGPDFESAR
ncbi:MAG: glycerophosphodiester phosphodiesterase [Herminiimonas sp.]|nr:glycerophosphodiester phosphodiesterase [Herminiimonas sp.]